MNYVRRVVSNFKGGVDVELGYRCLILGPNGSGKSAVTTSIEYALSGKVSDVVGRATVADVNQLLTLGPGDSIFAECEISDESIVRCETKGKKSSAPAHPTAFPLREVRDALGGSVETVRKFFLRMTSGAVSRADVENQIPGPYRELFGQVIAPTRADTPAVDLLLYALERSKGRARELASEAKAAGSVVAETTTGLVPVNEGDLISARESLARARADVQELTAALNRARQVASLVADEETTHARVTALAAQLNAIPPPAEADRVREELWGLLKYAEAKALGSCPCCRGAGVNWTERLASVAAKRTERGRELERYNAARTALDVAERSHAQAVARLDALGLTESPSCIPELESKLAETHLQSANSETRVIELERAAATWEQARRSRDAAAEREIQAQKWAGLSDACVAAVGTLMDTAVRAFEEKVQKYLPAGDRFSLQLRDGDREVCRYGFLRETGDGLSSRLDIALSGAEWARLTAALAAALVESESEALRVVIPDDRSWDARTLVTVLEALSAAPAQVIVATTTEPARIPDGWTVIRTGQKEQSEGFNTKREDEAAQLPSGDYIAMGSCSHGVSQGGYCSQCKTAREVKEENTRRMREAGVATQAVARSAPPRETLATTDLVSVASAKRGRGRPKGSKNKPKTEGQPVSQDQGTAVAPEPAPEPTPTSSDTAFDLE